MPGTFPSLITLASASVAATILISFVEHLLHRVLMHRRTAARFAGRFLPVLEEAFCAHTIQHHGRWYKAFDHEPDPAGRWENIRAGWAGTAAGLVLVCPLLVLLGMIWPWPQFGGVFASAVIVGAVLHNRAWDALHIAMHMPERRPRWLRTGPTGAIFGLLAKHHYLHHESPGRNFNLVLPIADYLLGTAVDTRRWPEARRRRVEEELRRMGL